MQSTTKIQIKIQIGAEDFTWVHFCYVPSSVKRNFDMFVNTEGFQNNYWIAVWAYYDFEMQIIDTTITMRELKKAIKNKYKEKYPELYIDNTTDNQGWLRVWYTEHMERELKQIGR